MLVKNGAPGPHEPIAGYEMALDFNGLPFELIPRAASQIKGCLLYTSRCVSETGGGENAVVTQCISESVKLRNANE